MSSRRPGPPLAKKRGRVFWTRVSVAVIVLTIIVGILYFAYGPYGGYGGSNNGLIIDWRFKLIINYPAKPSFTIPANIGVEGGSWFNHTLDQFGQPPRFAPIGTRDSSGTVYIQANVATVFTFGDFFNIWGQNFTVACVLDYCGNGSQARPLPSMSDGTQDRCLNRNFGLSNGKTWTISVGTVPATGGCITVGP
jgi:hypothetical protein